ncbi:aminodeoxychorismate/anthranilate synthase component II [Streptomyces qinglanensis]|uniref:Aminodeoxychorismate synthase n=1 Tax=Streptomyces qinglanensis TaxID=943816 RepID=A0A1H9PWA2_9ACTN|nr:aminodeoxychorismate/anthranilate synthase component II [Streptomyces qinglanensis]SER52487.1 para-aminobenzoate synthetase component 2 [Streptomyces qinglanensis]
MSARILVVDNYDSFVFNLVQYLYQLGATCEVVRNDEVEPGHAEAGFDGVLLSPGPGAPEEAGVCISMVRHCADRGIPVFGVCLGMQSMAVAYGGVVGRAPELLHGKTSVVSHEGAGVFAGLPSPFTATRYHSLAVRGALPDPLEITAWTAPGGADAATPAPEEGGAREAGLVMGLRHRELPVEGVQFHPESVLTECGHLMLANWLVRCGDTGAVERSAGLEVPRGAGLGTVTG